MAAAEPAAAGLVYFLLIDILRGHGRGPVFFAHLIAGMFAFHFFSGAITLGVKSVDRGGRLILNTAFPRSLLPLSAGADVVRRFVPTLGIYAVDARLSGLPIGWQLLWILPISRRSPFRRRRGDAGRGPAGVLPRRVELFALLLRIWMYCSPVLYFLAEIPPHLAQSSTSTR